MSIPREHMNPKKREEYNGNTLTRRTIYSAKQNREYKLISLEFTILRTHGRI
jgi:hypothetical protein